MGLAIVAGLVSRVRFGRRAVAGGRVAVLGHDWDLLWLRSRLLRWRPRSAGLLLLGSPAGGRGGLHQEPYPHADGVLIEDGIGPVQIVGGAPRCAGTQAGHRTTGSGEIPGEILPAQGLLGDRKSTRLNSSHVAI